MPSRISVGQKVRVESTKGKPPYEGTVIRTEGPMVLVKGSDGEIRLVPLRDVTPCE